MFRCFASFSSRLMGLLFPAVLFAACVAPDEPEDAVGKQFLSEVFDYVYAPGQHAALAQESDVQYCLGDPEDHTQWLYLGGFGGYVVAGFPVDVPNQDGADFEVFAQRGPAPEPAVVFVMADENGDGHPNDTWYELGGSALSESCRDYAVTYYRPETDSVNIAWRDNAGNSGHLTAGFGSLYTAGWWWPALAGDSITLRGTRLPDAYVNAGSEEAPYWVVPDDRYAWGYAENRTGSDYDAEQASNRLDIDQAIDAAGQPVELTHIRFIKIQSGVFQQAGPTNEVSSEIRGARIIP